MYSSRVPETEGLWLRRSGSIPPVDQQAAGGVTGSLELLSAGLWGRQERFGSGCVIRHRGLRCLLTNAHVVADASYVEAPSAVSPRRRQVRKAGTALKFSAKRLKIAHECDLALLSREAKK